MTADLAADTAVRADPEVRGRYHLTLPDHWDYLNPSGGVVMTCALRAAVAELNEPPLRLASATAIFATPIRSGALVADVATIRRGRAATQLRVAMRSPGSGGPGDASEAGKDPVGGVELTATFLRERRGPDVKGVAFPRVKSLEDSLPVDDAAPNNPHTRFRFHHQIETRIADGERYWIDGLVAGPARYARWFRYRAPQRDDHGNLDRLALPPLIDTMPTALGRAIGPGAYRFNAPSLDLTTYVVDDTSREWLLVTATVRRARAGWAIADAEVWDDTGRFVAYGSQAMYLQNLSGEPPTIDASER
jgi:acyl-CoA thioesterase